MASVACKSLGKLCKNGLLDYEIKAEDLDELVGSQAWLAESVAGRQHTVRRLSFICKNTFYRSKPFDHICLRPQVPFLLPSGMHICLSVVDSNYSNRLLSICQTVLQEIDLQIDFCAVSPCALFIEDCSGINKPAVDFCMVISTRFSIARDSFSGAQFICFWEYHDAAFMCMHAVHCMQFTVRLYCFLVKVLCICHYSAICAHWRWIVLQNGGVCPISSAAGTSISWHIFPDCSILYVNLSCFFPYNALNVTVHHVACL